MHDTQTAIFDYGDLQVVWTQRNWGANPDPKYPWGATLYGDKGTLKLSVQSYDFIPNGDGTPVHGDFLDEREKYPEDAQHKETEIFAAPATRRHMQNFLAARREEKRPVADIEQGYISSACCILANLSMELGRSLKWDADAGRVVGRRRSQRPARAIPRRLGASDAGECIKFSNSLAQGIIVCHCSRRRMGCCHDEEHCLRPTCRRKVNCEQCP